MSLAQLPAPGTAVAGTTLASPLRPGVAPDEVETHGVDMEEPHELRQEGEGLGPRLSQTCESCGEPRGRSGADEAPCICAARGKGAKRELDSQESSEERDPASLQAAKKLCGPMAWSSDPGATPSPSPPAPQPRLEEEESVANVLALEFSMPVMHSPAGFQSHPERQLQESSEAAVKKKRRSGRRKTKAQILAEEVLQAGLVPRETPTEAAARSEGVVVKKRRSGRRKPKTSAEQTSSMNSGVLGVTWFNSIAEALAAHQAEVALEVAAAQRAAEQAASSFSETTPDSAAPLPTLAVSAAQSGASSNHNGVNGASVSKPAAVGAAASSWPAAVHSKPAAVSSLRTINLQKAMAPVRPVPVPVSMLSSSLLPLPLPVLPEASASQPPSTDAES